MKPRCQVGDDAFILSTRPDLNFLVGHVCKVIGVDTSEDWQVELSGPDMKAVSALYPWVMFVTADDHQLFPIRPGETPEESAEAIRKIHELPQGVPA